MTVPWWESDNGETTLRLYCGLTYYWNLANPLSKRA